MPKAKIASKSCPKKQDLSNKPLKEPCTYFQVKVEGQAVPSYACTTPGCPRPDKLYKKKDSLLNHWSESHAPRYDIPNQTSCNGVPDIKPCCKTL